MPVYSAELLKQGNEAVLVSKVTPTNESPIKAQKQQRLACIANRAQRGLDLPMIEEGELRGEEEETIKAEKGGLYRPAPVDRQRQIHSRDNSMSRKNREMLQHAVAPHQPKPSPLISGQKNYYSEKVAHSVNVKSTDAKKLQLYRELGEEVKELAEALNRDKLGILKGPVHDTKTPVILSQKSRAMREVQNSERNHSSQQLVLPRLPSSKVSQQGDSDSQHIHQNRLYGRESSATRETSALQRNPSSASRKYLMPNEILRNVRSSH